MKLFQNFPKEEHYLPKRKVGSDDISFVIFVDVDVAVLFTRVNACKEAQHCKGCIPYEIKKKITELIFITNLSQVLITTLELLRALCTWSYTGRKKK